MSADGKIADISRGAARLGSANDLIHLEEQVAQADAVLFGAGTLRAYGTTLRVSQPHLLQQRQQQGKPAQPIQIVASRSGAIDPHARFFQQPIPRWLLTTPLGRDHWQTSAGFDRILVAGADTGNIDWQVALQQLAACGINHLAVLGGGTIVASLLAADAIDELWLTVCPLLLGGIAAPTPIEGDGFLAASAPRLRLLQARSLQNEVFLHYRIDREDSAIKGNFKAL